MCSLIFSLVLSTYLFDAVAGWGFLPPRSVAEGASATFEITNTDGGGYFFPYTMTVLKQVENSGDDQVGLVYTNDTIFYWDCNQAAGTSLRFRLVSKANVNAATSDYIKVQTGAQAVASSLSLKSLASVTSTQDPTNTRSPSTATATSVESDRVSQKNVPVGAVVGGVVGGVLLLLVMAFVVIRMRRSRKFNYAPEVARQEPVTPLTYAPPPHHAVPPMGYVAYPSVDPTEEPPLYSPRGPDADSTSYFTGPASSTGGTMTEISEAPPPRRGKTGYGPVGTRHR